MAHKTLYTSHNLHQRICFIAIFSCLSERHLSPKGHNETVSLHDCQADDLLTSAFGVEEVTMLRGSEFDGKDDLGMMLSFKNFWRRSFGSGDVYRPPEKDEHMVACDTLMSELDFHIKELDRSRQEQEQEERRMKTGVDYTWLMESQPKSYEIPQMERLELEELCYKVSGSECTQVISLFRDAMLRNPPMEDLPYIMRSCVRKILDERPVPETLTEWVTRRTQSIANFSAFSNLRLKPSGKVVPSVEVEDIEMQNNDFQDRKMRALSVPNFAVHKEGGAYPF